MLLLLAISQRNYLSPRCFSHSVLFQSASCGFQLQLKSLLGVGFCSYNFGYYQIVYDVSGCM